MLDVVAAYQHQSAAGIQAPLFYDIETPFGFGTKKRSGPRPAIQMLTEKKKAEGTGPREHGK